jgi:hypothetical protein
MSFVVIGKVGTTQGIGETTETGVLKADTTADVMGDKIEWSVETRDKTNVVTRDKTKDKTKWSVVTKDKTNVMTRDKTKNKTKWNAVTKDKTKDKTKWNVVTKDKTKDKIKDKIGKVREWSDIKVVLNTNPLLVVTEIKVIRTT